MKIKFLLSIVWSIAVAPTYATTFITHPIQSDIVNVYLKVKKIDTDGQVTTLYKELRQEANLDDLRTETKIGSEHQFFYNQTKLSNALTMCEYVTRFSPWKEQGFNLIAIPPSQVDFAMDYLPIEKKYRELKLTPLERYTYSSGARICVQVEGYIRRAEKELGASIVKEVKQLIALYTSIRCAPLYAPCIKRALCNPIQTKLFLSSAYKEHVGGLIFDLLTPFISENKPCHFLATLPEEAIRFLYMHKDHFLHVKLLRWLTDTQQAPLPADDTTQKDKPYYQLKKSCIDSLLTHGELPLPLLKKVITEAKDSRAWDVLVSLAYHGFLDRSWSPYKMPYTGMLAPFSKKKDSALKHFIRYHCSTMISEKEAFSLLENHPSVRYKLLYTTDGQSVQKMSHLRTYTYTDMVKGAVLLSLVVYLGARYITFKK